MPPPSSPRGRSRGDAILDVAEENKRGPGPGRQQGHDRARRFLLGAAEQALSHHAPCDVGIREDDQRLLGRVGRRPLPAVALILWRWPLPVGRGGSTARAFSSTSRSRRVPMAGDAGTAATPRPARSGTLSRRPAMGVRDVEGDIRGDGTVYVGSADHYFYALRPDGRLLWRFRNRGIIDSVGGDWPASQEASGAPRSRWDRVTSVSTTCARTRICRADEEIASFALSAASR